MVMRILTKMLVQNAVYWGNASSDGYGGLQVDAPVELDVRWEDVQKKVVTFAGEEIVSAATVYVSADLVLGAAGWGFLWLGALATLSAKGIMDYTQLDGREDGLGRAWEVKHFEKLPTLKGDQYLRTAYL